MSDGLTLEQRDAAAVTAFNEGVRAMRDGDPDAAAAAWTRAVALDPGMAPALRNLVVFHEERQQLSAVVDIYQRLLAFDPFDTEALVRQASALIRTGHSALAAQNYERAIAIYPFFRFWYDELAQLLDQIGELPGAAAWRDRAASLDSDEAEMAFEDAVRKARTGNSELAMAIFEAVLEDFPTNLDARVHLARLLAGADRVDEALEQLDAAVEVGGFAQARALFERGRLLAEHGRREEATRDLQAAIALESGYGLARRLLERLHRAAAAPVNEPEPVPAPEPAKAAEPASQATADSPTVGQTRSSAEISIAQRVMSSQTGAYTAPRDALPAAASGYARSGDSPAATSQLGGGSPQVTGRVASPMRASAESVAAPLVFPQPDPELPWLEQVRQVVRQATSVPSRSGSAGRVALLIEATEPVAMATDAVLRLLSRPDLGLLQGGGSRVYCVEGEARPGEGVHGVASEGWLGQSFREPNYARWPSSSTGLPIDRMLETATLAVGSEGFNVALVLTTGAVRADQNATANYVRQLPTYQIAVVQTGPDGGLLGRLEGVAPNLAAISTRIVS